MKAVAIVAHLGKTEVASITRDVVNWLCERNIKVKIPEDEALTLNRPDLGYPEEKIAEDIELVIVLGGDGTILRAVRLLRGSDIPILGVNLGKFGFLSEIEVKDLYPALTRIMNKDFSLQKRMMLDCEVVQGRKSLAKHMALNEIVVGRGVRQRLLEFDVYINDEFFGRYASDGLIFATPTGSTAYSLSVGGPLVSPDTRLILMTPVCPHSLFNRTVILNDTDEIKVCSKSEQLRVTVSADGMIIFEGKPFDFVRISTSASSISLVKLNGRNFYTLLKEKLAIWESF
ncbi:MAG: NAD(+)/NADH kinase [Actinomycetota bacterium]|nr:NAD(+)/NADH kinase [Actinomycetota bacterium]